jgi:hypothetical protein
MATRTTKLTQGELATIESNLFSSDLADNCKAMLHLQNVPIPKLAKATGRKVSEITKRLHQVKRKVQKAHSPKGK